jgi:hypothetical protein
MIFRCAMAVETPFHALGLMLIDDLHLIDRAVAGIAAHTAIHVHGVIEIREVRNAVDLDPIDYRTVTVASIPGRAHRLELRTLRLYLLMTAHARLHGWHVGMRSHFHIAVAIPAVHAKLLNMEVMLKGYGLRGFISDPGVFRSEIVGDSAGNRRPEHSNAHRQLPRKLIRPLWEEICHLLGGDLAVNCGDYRRIAGN